MTDTKALIAKARENMIALVLAVAVVFCLPVLFVLLLWPTKWLIDIFLWAIETLGPTL